MFGIPILLILFLVAVITAVVALIVKDLLAAAIFMMTYSFIAAVLYAVMGAVDVAFTEAAVGAGISGVFIIAALFFLNRRSED